MTKFLLFIALSFMMQISGSSKNDSLSQLIQETDKQNWENADLFDVTQSITTDKERESQWADAETFVPLLFQKNENIEKEKSKQTYWLEDVLNISGIGRKRMIAKYLSNIDLYKLQQGSKIISNTLQDELIKRLAKYKKKKEKTLKEYFVSDFNAFINYAYNENPVLDFLELEIPGKVLEYLWFETTIMNGPRFYIRTPTNGEHKIFQLCINGYKIDGSYDPTSKETEFQLNKGETCELIDYTETETRWEKIYKLNKRDTFKFKFYFQKCGKNHQLILWGQKFSFLLFRFDLRRQTGKKFSCKTLADFYHFHDGVKKTYRIPEFSSTPEERVKMCEDTGMKFKFKFYTAFKFNSPLEIFNPHYFEKNNNNLDDPYLNVQNNFHYTHVDLVVEYNTFHNFNFQNSFYCTGEKYNISQDFNFQNQQNYKGEKYQNLNLEQESSLEEYDGFEQNSFFQENTFDKENSIVKFAEENINPEIFENQIFSPSTVYSQKNEDMNYL